MVKRYASNEYVDAYIGGVLSGEIPVGVYARLAVERHVHDLERQADPDFPYYFDEPAGQHVIEFYKFCSHVEGELAGQPFVPLPWQQFVDLVSFGWKKKSDGTRRFSERWEEVCRGNGKSFWLACTLLYFLVGDGEPGAKVYAAATKEDQAALVWGMGAEIAKQSPELSAVLKISDSVNNRLIIVPGTFAFFRPLGGDSKTADGLNPHAVSNDEVHEHRSRRLYAKLKTAMGKRRQPMLTNITTAGEDAGETIYEELRDHAVRVLEGWRDGSFVDDRFFAIIYAIDDADDPFDENAWPKGNPSLGGYGAGVKIDYLREMSVRSQHDPEAKRDFLRMHCGRRASSVTRAIALDVWDACVGYPDGAAINWDDHLGRPCILALDLSSTRDLTSLCQLFPPDELYPFWLYRWFNWLPTKNLAKKCEEDGVPYDQWAEDPHHWLELTEGNQIDELAVVHRVQELHETHQVLQITNDPWHAVQLGNVLQRESGIEIVGYRQDLKNFGAAVMHFLDEIVVGQLRHDGNPLVRWCAGNVVTKEDADGNRRFHKKLSKRRIDPMTAATMARGRALVLVGDGASMYDEPDGGEPEGDEPPPPPPAFRGPKSMYDEAP